MARQIPTMGRLSKAIFGFLGGTIMGIVGIIQNLTKVYQPEWDLDWLGVGFDRVMVFIVMLIILMIRPYGLFGTKEVHRV